MTWEEEEEEEKQNLEVAVTLVTWRLKKTEIKALPSTKSLGVF